MKHYNSAQKVLFIVLFAALNVISQSSFAQDVEVPQPESSFTQNLNASVALGASAYLGDLVQRSPVFKEVSPAASVGISYDIVKQFRARVNFSILGAKGDDKNNSKGGLVERNLNFKTTILEVSFLGEYDFLKEGTHTHPLVPYVFLGPGLYHFNPTTIDRNGDKIDLHDMGTEGQFLGSAYADRKYNLTQLNLQFGAGARIKITEMFSLGAELSIRKLFTDYLDDVSGPTYPASSEFISAGQVAASQLSYRGDELGYTFSNGGIRGNPDKKDSYYSFQIRGTLLLK